MRTADFEASLAEAKLYPELWRLALGIGLALLLWSGTGVLVIGIAAGIAAAEVGPFGILPWLRGLAQPSTPVHTLLLLATFAGLFIGAITAAAALHFRPPGTLFGAFADWRRGFLTTLALTVPVYAALIGLSVWLDPPVPALAPGLWARVLPFALALIFLQIAAEELFFRGYLQQQLAARFQARWIWMWIPAVVFALLHWNPEAGMNLPLILLSALTFGLVAADLTERTGNLGAAMGLHFVNNVTGLTVVAIADTVTGLALFVTPLDIAEIGPQSVSMALSVVFMLGIWAVLVRLLDR